MNNDTEETTTDITPPPAADSFGTFTDLLAVIADAKACGSRLRSLQEATATATKAVASLAAAKAQHDAVVSKERAYLDERKTALDEREVELHSKARQLDERQRAVSELHKEVQVRENQLKRRLLRETGVTYNEALQTLPNWPELDREVYGTSDPQFDQQRREGEQGSENEPVVNDRPDLTLRRAAPVRRSRRHAAEEGHA
jgi:hypothetical protein